jgi:hypothetical protein
MIEAIISGLVGSYLVSRLFPLVKPKKKSQFDTIPFDELKARNNWIEIAANTVVGAGLVAMFVAMQIFGLDHNPWRVGFYLCFPFTMFILFVAAVTMKGGFIRFREFWRYHELSQRTRLALLLSILIPIATVGAMSAFEVFG